VVDVQKIIIPGPFIITGRVNNRCKTGNLSTSLMFNVKSDSGHKRSRIGNLS
jgi:hypothetical protein